MYLLVGELINTTRESVKKAVLERDEAFIQDLARRQAEAGIQYLDVNCGDIGTDKEEVEAMQWLVTVVRKVTDLPLCIDSPNAEALAAGLALAPTPTPMINSITAEQKRYQDVLPLVLQYKAKIVGLCISDEGMPNSVEDRERNARWLVENLRAAGVKDDDIYLDPLVKPVSINDQHGVEVLEFIRRFKQAFPQVHLICGLSNVSFGLPGRRFLNRTFLVQTMTCGMDAYLLDPTDKELMRLFYASAALLGKDRFCGRYLRAYRSGLYS
ncbi:MAG: dihydropteroate synthase [Moorellales bacterium]